MSWAFLAERVREPEWMDEPGVDPALIRQSLKFIRRVNRVFGYTRATIAHFEQFSRRWKPGERITILDVATGSADIPIAVRRWGSRRGFDIRILGIDLHALTARVASEQAAKTRPAISIAQGDALRLPLANGGVDYAMTNMFLHHLDESSVVGVLREMDRVAARGIIAADLLRDPRAYRWIRLFTILANPMVRHDARVSVAQAFNRDEIEALARSAGAAYASFREHFGYRFALAGEKS